MYLVPKTRGRKQLGYYIVSGQQFPIPLNTPGLSGLGSTRNSRRALARVFAIRRQARRFNGLGDTMDDVSITNTPIVPDFGDGSYTLPTDATPAPKNPVQTAYQNLLTSAKPSSSPLDYTSPQAAISAGLDPTQVNNTWAQALAKFPTQNAAVTAGVPAGVVTQLWPASRAAVVSPSSGGSSLLPIIALGAGGLLLLGALRHR